MPHRGPLCIEAFMDERQLRDAAQRLERGIVRSRSYAGAQRA
jgi:hypothetical protein